MGELTASNPPLADFSIVEISGDDARTFLQGQLTNDVFALTPGLAQWQGYCQPQGRLIATFPLACAALGSYWAALPTTIAAAVAKRLSMFVLRSKAKVAINPERGLAFSAAAAEGFIQVGASSLFVQKVPSAQPARPADDFFRHATHARVAIIDSGAQDVFVPQTVGWDNVGVNFKKGCYPGQEIVARAHYRGAVKRKPVTISGVGTPPTPGSPLVVAGDEVGHLVRPVSSGAAEQDGSWTSLASIHQDALHAGVQAFDGMGDCRVVPFNP